jgi:hypothetical protein
MSPGREEGEETCAKKKIHQNEMELIQVRKRGTRRPKVSTGHSPPFVSKTDASLF